MRILPPATLAALAAVLSAAPLQAHDFRFGDIVVDHPYALASTASVYFRTLTNNGRQPDRLLGASSPSARQVELLRDGQPAGLALAPGDSVRLRHDGPWQLALRGLAAPLKTGDTLRITLRFEQSGEATVPATVVEPRAHPRH